MRAVPLRSHVAAPAFVAAPGAPAFVAAAYHQVYDYIWLPVPATDTEHSKPGGAGVRGRGALSGGSTRGARGAGAEPSGAKGCAGSNPSGSYQKLL